MVAKPSGLTASRKDNDDTLVRAAAVSRVGVAVPICSAHARPGQDAVDGIEANNRVGKRTGMN